MYDEEKRGAWSGKFLILYNGMKHHIGYDGEQMIVILSIVAILVVIIAVLAFSLIGQYNSLVKFRSRYRNAFAQIEVQLKRRYDLIPNLVETAKSFMAHERETLEAVITARNAAQTACNQASQGHADGAAVGALASAESGLSNAMGRFWGLSESYPDLKSNQNMMQLSEELTSSENKVAFARQAYNDAVTSYNTKMEVFPTNMIAGFFNFTPALLFEVADASERDAVKVDFGS